MENNKEKMSNESILLCAVEQSSLEESVLILPDKRDGWELTAAGTSTPTLSEEINDFWNCFCLSQWDSTGKKMGCFLVEISIDTAVEQ